VFRQGLQQAHRVGDGEVEVGGDEHQLAPAGQLRGGGHQSGVAGNGRVILLQPRRSSATAP